MGARMASSVASSGSHVNKGTGPKFGALLDRAKEAAKPASDAAKLSKMTIGAGCFWGVELAYQRIPGVTATRVGYMGGKVDNPTYKQVCSGTTGHAEVVETTFDPKVVAYGELLDVLFERHDATTLNQQGNDVGTQYRSIIFYHDDDQKTTALKMIEEHAALIKKKVVTEVEDASKHTFWPAEDYHQKYLENGGQCSLKGDKSKIRCYG